MATGAPALAGIGIIGTWSHIGPGSMHDAHSYRRDWLPQVLVLGVVALLGTVPFWVTDLDLRAAALFYHPELDNPWYQAEEPLWSFLYIAPPLLTGLVMLGGLLVLAGGNLWSGLRRLRLYAILVIAAALLGPGLVVNGVFKDNWGRPRPNQVEALGGTKDYLPPLMVGERGKGKSFPCGHSSVGYMLGVFFLIWRRSRPRLAWVALAGAIVLGTLIGVGRMTAGDHFLSDVIWSAVFAYGIALVLYYWVLRVPERELAMAGRPPLEKAPLKYPVLAAAAYGLASLVLLGGVLLATPVNDSAQDLVRAGEFDPAPRALRIEADEANLILYWMGGEDPGLFRLKARGFGLPTARANRNIAVRDGVLTYRVSHQGIFTERDTRLLVGLVASQWDRVEVRLGSGDIRVHPVGPTGPDLDLGSADGAVRRE